MLFLNASENVMTQKKNAVNLMKLFLAKPVSIMIDTGNNLVPADICTNFNQNCLILLSMYDMFNIA